MLMMYHSLLSITLTIIISACPGELSVSNRFKGLTSVWFSVEHIVCSLIAAVKSHSLPLLASVDHWVLWQLTSGLFAGQLSGCLSPRGGVPYGRDTCVLLLPARQPRQAELQAGSPGFWVPAIAAHGAPQLSIGKQDKEPERGPQPSGLWLWEVLGSILKEINPECSLEGLMLKLKLQYFDHLMRSAVSLEKTLMLGKIDGRRRRGRQRMRRLDGITDSMDEFE